MAEFWLTSVPSILNQINHKVIMEEFSFIVNSIHFLSVLRAYSDKGISESRLIMMMYKSILGLVLC